MKHTEALKEKKEEERKGSLVRFSACLERWLGFIYMVFDRRQLASNSPRLLEASQLFWRGERGRKKREKERDAGASSLVR